MDWKDEDLQAIRNRIARKYGEDIAQEALFSAIQAYKEGGVSGLETLAIHAARQDWRDSMRAQYAQKRQMPNMDPSDLVQQPTQLARVEALEVLEAVPREKLEELLEIASLPQTKAEYKRRFKVYRLREDIRQGIAAMGLTVLTMIGVGSTELVNRLVCNEIGNEMREHYDDIRRAMASDEMGGRAQREKEEKWLQEEYTYQGWTKAQWEEALCPSK